MNILRPSLLILLAAALVGGIAAGSASGTGGTHAAAAAVTGDASRTDGRGAVATPGVDPRAGGLEIALGEWAISPEARAIRPGRVTLVITNRGKFRHGLELEIRRVDGRHGNDDHGEDDAKSVRLSPGQATRMTMNLAAGVYAIECFVSHHDDLGMRGTLEVREDAPLLRPAPARQATIAISGFAFKPATLRTTVGKTVTWRNADAAPHTASWPQVSSPQLNKGGSYRRTFARAGTYAYLCALHPGMRGKVVVGAAGS